MLCQSGSITCRYAIPMAPAPPANSLHLEERRHRLLPIEVQYWELHWCGFSIPKEDGNAE
jgi:hypothetical protein